MEKNLMLFMRWLLRSYNEDSCTLFYNIYKKIMDDLGIQSLYGKSFFMEI